MNLRNTLLASSLALALACSGSSTTAGSGSAALDAATPSYAALSMDQVSTDATISANAPTALTSAPQPDVMLSGDGCHPHLFLRQREVVERVNRHIYKALRHVEVAIARNPLSATDDTKTWESVENGIDRKFTISLVSADVYSWELDIGPVGTTPLPVVMTGQIDRTGATGPHQGKGTFHIDFAKLHAGYPSEKATQGTLDVSFDVEAASRNLTVTATDVAWDLDATRFSSAAMVTALSAPRSGAYVYYREPGKGGSLKIEDQMVYVCPANPSLVPADAQLVSRWYKASDTTIHGRSDAFMKGGQLAAPVDHLAAVTCQTGRREGDEQAEGFWLMKAEDASGNTISGESSQDLGESTTACDPIFGVVPELADNHDDFTGWPSSYSDGTPFPFPNM
jgi:hypothetical protein